MGRVREVLTKIVEANDLQGRVDLSKLQIKVLHSDLMGLFFNFDGTLFVSYKCLKMTEGSPEQLGLLIAHELAHFLLQH